MRNMNTFNQIHDAWDHADRNKIAALLSILPGAGHLYKHRYLEGAGILIGGNIMMLFVTAWLSLATFGLALIVVPAVYIAIVAAAAYYAVDLHGAHTFLHPWRNEHRNDKSFN